MNDRKYTFVAQNAVGTSTECGAAAPRIYNKDRLSSVVHSPTTTYRMTQLFTLTNSTLATCP